MAKATLINISRFLLSIILSLIGAFLLMCYSQHKTIVSLIFALLIIVGIVVINITFRLAINRQLLIREEKIRIEEREKAKANDQKKDS